MVPLDIFFFKYVDRKSTGHYPREMRTSCDRFVAVEWVMTHSSSDKFTGIGWVMTHGAFGSNLIPSSKIYTVYTACIWSYVHTRLHYTQQICPWARLSPQKLLRSSDDLWPLYWRARQKEYFIAGINEVSHYPDCSVQYQILSDLSGVVVSHRKISISQNLQEFLQHSLTLWVETWLSNQQSPCQDN